MKFTVKLLSGAAVAAAAVGGASVALAQSAGAPAASEEPERKTSAVLLEEIVIVGIRASLQGAQDLKRNSDTIQDSIVAEDIGKLPDVTAVEALQRITGVQIGRDLGEGGGTVTIGGVAVNSGIEIRGLPQVETTLNGREVFTATGSRVLNFEDIPSTLLAGIDVYKDPTANLLEGGIGGTVDLRTRKPFDFKGLEVEGSGAEHYGDLVNTAKPEVTALFSNRWDTGIGEMGALASIGFQDRSYREDQTAQSGTGTNTTLVPGTTLDFSTGALDTKFVGERKRTGLDGVLQWQPLSDLQFYGEASSQELSSRQNQYQFAAAGTAANLLSATTFPGTVNVNTDTFKNSGIQSIASYRSVVDVNRQFALNGKWTPGRLTLQGDLSYITATEMLFNPAVGLTTTAPTMSQNITAGGAFQTTVGGIDLTNLNSYTAGYAYSTTQFNKGDEKAGKFDVDYSLGEGFFSSVSGGVRVAVRNYEFSQQSAAFTGFNAARLQANPQLFGLVPFSPLYSKTEGNAVQPAVLAVNPDLLRHDLGGVEAALGVPGPLPATTAPYSAQEKSDAAYVRTNFNADIGILMDGNIGVRFVRTEEDLLGMAGNPTTGFAPLSIKRTTNDPLPSLNLRLKLTDDLQWRFGASRVVTHPDFGQLKPSLTLLAASQSATGGNPFLKPTKATQLDSSLEWYFAPASSATAAVFYKKVTDFVVQKTTQLALTVDGVTYNLTGPINAGAGTIKGVEFGYQQFMDFLPGLWSGLGAQLNYTYVESNAPTAVVGSVTSLPGLSKNSFNAVGFYEKGPVSFRLAYTRRSQFYQTLFTGATAPIPQPIYVHAFGWLDASFTYNVTNQWSVFAQGSNLLRTRLFDFYNVETLPHARTEDDRQFSLGFRFKL